MKKIILYLIQLLWIWAAACPALAQRTIIYDKPDAEFRDALELFSKEKYVSAQHKFLQLARTAKDKSAEWCAQSEYYAALCAAELFNPDAENLTLTYIRNHSEHTKVNSAWFQLARYHFRNKKYTEALNTFYQVDRNKLSADEQCEYDFKFGYCAFVSDSFETAKKSFFLVKDKDNKYAAGANYYYAHIAYTEKNYETALKSFQKIKRDETYGKFAPYYIAQIYYLQKKYDELLAVATALLDSATSRRVPEIARMIADAYFQKQQYEEAIPYLQVYFDKTPNPPARDDFYQMGFCLMKTGNCEKAIPWFRKINTDIEDSLSQITLYHLGDCSIQMNEKHAALSYLKKASAMNFDADLRENALYNYAKLTYETSYNPFNEAINAFETYITSYPNSPFIDEAYSYLSSVYLSTKNYKAALSSLEKIKKRDVQQNKIYQKVSYFRAIELFNDTLFNEAIRHFNKSLSFPADDGFTALALYWKGEAYYRLGTYDSALVSYQQFLRSPGALTSGVYALANYNAGYCYFNQKNYKTALTYFRKYLADAGKEDVQTLNDAYLRAGDCCFMLKDFNNAILYYDKSIATSPTDNDYALYQKALSYGPLGKPENKIATFQELLNKYPKSVYYDDALFEIGVTYQNQGQSQKAIDAYEKLISQRPGSPYISRCYLRKGLIYYKINQDEQALTSLKYVVENYRGTPESRDAIEILKNVFVSLDRVQDFVELVKSLGGNVTDREQDSMAYFAVWNNKSDNCQTAKQGFRQYLERFPNGEFTIDANFYKAECEYSDGEFAEALKGYKYVIEKPASKYLETSLSKAAEICYKQKNYAEALSYYKKLENIAQYKSNITLARLGQMRCEYQLSNYRRATEVARTLLTTEKLEQNLKEEAMLTLGRSALAMDSLSTAFAEFMQLSRQSNNEMGAEAKWNLGYIQYLFGNYEQAQKHVIDLINQVPSYEYWVARAFILWADIYVKLGNLRQAKYTLQSIIDNYEGADLIKLAQDKYNAIVQLEKQEELKKQQQQQNINPEEQVIPEGPNPKQ